MSQFDVDIPDTAFDGPSEAPEPVEAPAAEAPAEAPAEIPAPEAAEAESAEPKHFDEAYVKELRQESANYRTRAKPFVEAFDGIDESDRDVFLGLASLYKTDPIAAGKEMARLAQGLIGDDAPEAEAAPADNEPKYMTRQDYENLKRQEAIEAAAVQIERDAKALGYERGTPEYTYLLAVAQTKNGDLNAAHAYVQEREQAAISRYVSSKEAAAAGHPTAPAEAASPASSQRELKTWRDVEAVIDEMF